MLRSKYKYGDDLIPQVSRKRSDSNLWKGVCSGWTHLQKNLIWRAGDGNCIQFWNHSWIPKLGVLKEFASSYLSSTDLIATVNNFLTLRPA